jgi:diaminopimelate decarboxylase
MAEPASEVAGPTDAPGPGAATPWAASVGTGPHGLEVSGVPVIDLAERFGTPLVVFDEGEVRDRCRAVVATGARVLYAVKAFTSHAAIRLMLEEGLDLLASSGGEVETCMRAGASASRVVLHGNNKSDAELSFAVGAGVSHVIVDNGDELARLDRLARTAGRVQPILLRVVPDVRVKTHEAIATGHDESKFGIPIASIADLAMKAAGMPGVRSAGLHAHIGSQLLEPEPYRQVADALLDLAVRIRREAGVDVEVIDVGGGFGVTYTGERALDPAGLVDVLRDRVASRSRRLGLDPPTLTIEPGRWLVANAGLTLYRVGSRKRVRGRTLLAVDGGMSDNVRPMLYDARYTVVRADRADGPADAFTVVGRHCESGDTLAEEVLLPADTGPGALLAFAATGAYTYPLASAYNRAGRPAVVGVRDGSSTLWLRREDDADLERLEAPAPRAPAHVEPPAGVHIRPAAPRDARSFLEFWSAVVAEGGSVRSEHVRLSARAYRSRFRRSWTANEAQVVAVDDADHVVGNVYVQRDQHPVTRHVATLGIAVAAPHRGRRVGSALLSEAFRWARAVGVEKVVLSVYPDNTRAIALYRAFGFVQEGRLAKHSHKSSGYVDEILMAAWVER